MIVLSLLDKFVDKLFVIKTLATVNSISKACSYCCSQQSHSKGIPPTLIIGSGGRGFFLHFDFFSNILYKFIIMTHWAFFFNSKFTMKREFAF